MIELGAVAGFAAVAEKFGIVGILLLMIIYLVWNAHHDKKQCELKLLDIVNKLENNFEAIKTQIDVSNQIFKETIAFNEKFRDYVKDEIKDVKAKLEVLKDNQKRS
ncbi:hypothetical protein [Campylobacter fetus]|uniref:Uncharacterized protein n=2 Tax=Campylobacter fetus TaxID=196 RepID=A0AAX0HAC7_CAMFE|nr:hypothetical protein [Campylobacter fetus]ALV64663.1 hypothetical protein CFTSP3_0694 [Campylobacter fetus subsp. testudinum Sp3]OCR90211.1 hypothetical protein CFT12S02225_07525 [Campylobacter fetus subsp. testudinum]OCR91834.1 hypothetical protein CFT12S02263_08920 [Campylobacter fetus subsp. testudinum]OCR93801.1 hypothetical protein CFT12S02842_07590 [Campylobacter fetus subsp. testudinum]